MVDAVVAPTHGRCRGSADPWSASAAGNPPGHPAEHGSALPIPRFRPPPPGRSHPGRGPCGQHRVDGRQEQQADHRSGSADPWSASAAGNSPIHPAEHGSALPIPRFRSPPPGRPHPDRGPCGQHRVDGRQEQHADHRGGSADPWSASAAGDPPGHPAEHGSALPIQRFRPPPPGRPRPGRGPCGSAASPHCVHHPAPRRWSAGTAG